MGWGGVGWRQGGVVQGEERQKRSVQLVIVPVLPNMIISLAVLMKCKYMLKKWNHSCL